MTSVYGLVSALDTVPTVEPGEGPGSPPARHWSLQALTSAQLGGGSQKLFQPIGLGRLACFCHRGASAAAAGNACGFRR